MSRPSTIRDIILQRIQTVLEDTGISVSSVGGEVSTTRAPSPKAYTDGSGSITAGNTSQEIFAAKSDRSIVIIQNISSADIYINFGAVATIDSDSIKLSPESSITLEGVGCPSETVNVISATSGNKFIAKQG